VTILAVEAWVVAPTAQRARALRDGTGESEPDGRALRRMRRAAASGPLVGVAVKRQ